ncbi:hypothetical protein SAMN05216228_10859 [Rhizobium tibeticum]|uniref:Uncharacterized protein n=1 Tax=Rhizobium tibeticum TaxID=501024 RepID=A0A1H8WYB8_9HYPH|nr:hypothetical protein RTCCBAU85039_6759 [Rhizobium tibeticum]SEP32606.1 hypothetical protein SAMN05216228_10859 [Rhizobium tibeticum]
MPLIKAGRTLSPASAYVRCRPLVADSVAATGALASR